jgi:FtsH-binding integral membrane protein
MSDEAKRLEQKPPFPWFAAMLVIATLVSYGAMFAFIFLSDRTRPLVLVAWAICTAICFRLGMRALKTRAANASHQ